jgi:hypothetical protein
LCFSYLRSGCETPSTAWLQTKSTTKVDGGNINQATCPTFVETIVLKNAYSQGSVAQRLKQIVTTLGTSQPAKQSRVSPSLVWAGSRDLPGVGTKYNVWSGQVVDIFDSNAITSMDGFVQTVTSPPVTSFTIPAGKEAECLLIYSTVSLNIPYTLNAIFYFDEAGDSSWTTATSGEYQVRSAHSYCHKHSTKPVAKQPLAWLCSHHLARACAGVHIQRHERCCQHQRYRLPQR